MKTHWLLLVAVSFGVLASNTDGADWPQWRGPQRDGISQEAGLLKTWPKDGPRLLWQRNGIGSGYSTPSVVGEHLYVLSSEGTNNEFVLKLTVKDGKTVWSRRIGNVGHPGQRPSYPGARSTPTLDGNLLYALGSDGDLACLDAATGEVRWQKNVRTEFGGKHGEWAYAESPLIDGDVVVCTPGGPEATLVALNKMTGSVVWTSSVPTGDEAAYSSVIIAEVGGVKQYIQFLAKGVVGVEAKTGKVLWRYDETAQGSPANIPTPIEHNGYVYTASGRGGGGLVKLTATHGAFEAKETYHSAKLPTAIGGAVRIGDHLYGTTGRALLCIEFTTGKVVWQDRSIGAGSICYADGLLYIHGENGEVALVEATPEAYREKGRFTPPNAPDRGRAKAWAYPIIADGRLYIREVGTVWCFDVRAHPSVN